MYVTCPQCGLDYDDAQRWTICPHHRLEAPVDGPKYRCGMGGYCEGHDLYACTMQPPANRDTGSDRPTITAPREFREPTPEERKLETDFAIAPPKMEQFPLFTNLPKPGDPMPEGCVPGPFGIPMKIDPVVEGPKMSVVFYSGLPGGSMTLDVIQAPKQQVHVHNLKDLQVHPDIQPMVDELKKMEWPDQAGREPCECHIYECCRKCWPYLPKEIQPQDVPWNKPAVVKIDSQTEMDFPVDAYTDATAPTHVLGHIPQPPYPPQMGGDPGCLCRTCEKAVAVYLDQCEQCRERSTVADDRRYLAPGGEWEQRQNMKPSPYTPVQVAAVKISLDKWKEASFKLTDEQLPQADPAVEQQAQQDLRREVKKLDAEMVRAAGYPRPPGLTPQRQAAVDANTAYINSLTADAVEKMIQEGKCPYEPQHLIGVPIGMFHCPLCGEMVVAGMDHPKPDPEA